MNKDRKKWIEIFECFVKITRIGLNYEIKFYDHEKKYIDKFEAPFKTLEEIYISFGSQTEFWKNKIKRLAKLKGIDLNDSSGN